jgi:hypothetical protein
MIRDQHKEVCLLVKEMLSSEGGYYEESMAPLIGGHKPFRGKIEPLNRICEIRRKEYDAGTFHGIMEDVYYIHPVVICDEGQGEYIFIYKESELAIELAERFLEIWAHEFYERKMNEL